MGTLGSDMYDRYDVGTVTVNMTGRICSSHMDTSASAYVYRMFIAHDQKSNFLIKG